MTKTEQHEYTVWSQILADHTNSKSQHAEAKQNMERLEWKGVGEDLRHQISDLKETIEALKTAEKPDRTDSAEPAVISRMSNKMKTRFEEIESRLDILDEKVALAAGSDIAGFVRDEIETQIGLAAVQAIANAVTDVMGSKDTPEDPKKPTLAGANYVHPAELSDPEA